ncbi:MAG: hypothetical protein P1V21_25985 [Rhizobiaceae bacterium]|nr:hypothetical protein [Rhizobiaceae bacterium]
MSKSFVYSFIALLMMLPSHSNAGLLCKYHNLFKEDLSHLVEDKIRWDASSETLDFTELGEEWEEVCLTSKSEGGYDSIDVGQLRFKEGVLGKDICREDASEVIAEIFDHSGQVLLLSLTETLRTSKLPVLTTYLMSKPAGYRQCSPVLDAVAHCVPVNSHNMNVCLFLFEEEN